MHCTGTAPRRTMVSCDVLHRVAPCQATLCSAVLRCTVTSCPCCTAVPSTAMPHCCTAAPLGEKRPHVRKEKKALLGMTCLIPLPYTRTAEEEDAVEEEVVTVEEVVENAAKPTRCRPKNS